MTRKLIGTTKTNENGEAVFTYRPEGAGKVNIFAKSEDLESEKHMLYICEYYDKATIDNHNNIWTTSNTILDRQSEYTVLSEINTGNSAYARCNIPNECIIELEVLQVDGTPSSFFFQLVNSSNTQRSGGSIYNIGGALNTWVKVKLKITNTEMIMTNMDTQQTYTRTVSATDVSRFRFYTPSDTTTLYFRNFKIYRKFDNETNSISIASNKSTIQTGETSTLTITPRGENGYSVKNTDIDLYQDNIKVTTINSGSNGQCNYTYTGTGIGEAKFIAKYNNLLSETLSIYDSAFYDKGTTGTLNSRWWTSSNSSLNGDYTGLTFETSDANNSKYCSPKKNGNETTLNELTDWEAPFICEFIYISHTASYSLLEFRFNNDGVVSSSVFSLQNCTNEDVIRAEYDGTTLKYYKNGEYVSSDNKTGATMIRLNIRNGNLKFRDFKVYPLYDDTVSSVQIISNKPTIQSGETSTLTITPRGENGYPVRNVDLELYRDGVLIDTYNTGATGKITYDYVGTGSGDVSFQAEYDSILSEIYVIEDCIIYDTTPHSITGTTSSDAVYSIGYDDLGYDLSITDFTLEFTLKTTVNGEQFNIGAKSEWSVNPIKGNYRTYIGCTGGGKTAYGIRTTSTNGSEVGTTNSFTLDTDHTCKIVKSGHTLTYYRDGETLGAKTENWWSNYSNWSFYIVQWNTGTTTISNIKLKLER